MALTHYGCLYSWGIGESGQLGHNRLQSNEFPQLVDYIMPNVVGRIACGDHHSFCLASIRYAEIHPEVRKWKRIQDLLLQHKIHERRVHKELSEGLRTKQILEIEKQREELLQDEADRQKNDDEQNKKILINQLVMIKNREDIESEIGNTLEDLKRRANQLGRQVREADEEQQRRPKHAKKKVAPKKKASVSVHTGRSMASEKVEGGEDLPFQPLMPRIGFMETTQKSLMEVKKQTEKFKNNGLSVAKPDVKLFLRELFEQKKEYNKLCEHNKQLMMKHAKISRELSFMRPTDDDLNQKKRNQKILDDLQMKLVTKGTQLMETEENRANYNLYIIRMKEENLLISKQNDYLRHTKSEYERLVSKLLKVQQRVKGQKEHIEGECVNFGTDIRNFEAFTKKQLMRYQQMMNSTIKAKKKQQQSQIERENKQNQRKKKRKNRLIIEIKAKAKEAEKIEEEKKISEEKVVYYTQRFRKIAEATGLKDPEEIIQKFFSNDKIAEDLTNDIKHKSASLKELRGEEESLVKAIDAKKGEFKLSKWRDVALQEESMAEDVKRVKALKSEVERVSNSMLIIREGINSLLASVQECMGEEDQYEEDVEKALETLREKISRAWGTAKPQMLLAARKAAVES
mmetsp:Transcript_37681/g.72521  ORF Transcript_37681/g.72521 Transcript_37681/m.72521 type:complete len:630 (-) Transcript_37681:23-1912(-)